MTTRTRQQAGRYSRNKGARGEREAAEYLAEMLGIEAYRTKQRKGDPDAPDISDEGRLLMKHGIHFECKRDESTIGKALYKKLAQAKGDAWKDDVPVIISRRSHEDWVVAIYADDLIEFCERILKIKNDS